MSAPIYFLRAIELLSDAGNRGCCLDKDAPESETLVWAHCRPAGELGLRLGLSAPRSELSPQC